MSLDNLDCFHVDVTDFVATITIDAAPVNAQNRKFRHEIIEIFDVLGRRDDVRVIVLKSASKVFSAGADFSERSAIEDLPGGFANHNRLVRASFDAVMECPKPVIASVGGGAIGAGCVLALVCDILYVSESAYFAMTEVNFGMAGGVSYVMRAFGRSDARLMIFTGKRFAGSELYRMNVASACFADQELDSATADLAAELASKSPSALVAAKRSFQTLPEMSQREGYLFEQSQTAELAKNPDTKEAQAAFMEKRKPRFD